MMIRALPSPWRGLLRAPSASRPGTEGMALVLVLWMLGLVATLGIVAARLASAQQDGAAEALARVHADIAGGAAIDAAVWDIIKGRAQRGRGAASAATGNVTVSVDYENEMARIDINKADQPLLEGLFRAGGAPASEAVRLASAVIDWRDADDETTPGGAERLAYGPDRVPPGNAPFTDASEVGLVLGVSPALAARIAPLVTVTSGTDKIDPDIASDAVMLALPGMTPLRLGAYREAIRKGRPEGDARDLLGEAATYLGDGASPVWRMQMAIGSGSERVRHDVTVLVGSATDRPYDVLRFEPAREADIAPDRGTAGAARR